MPKIIDASLFGGKPLVKFLQGSRVIPPPSGYVTIWLMGSYNIWSFRVFCEISGPVRLACGYPLILTKSKKDIKVAKSSLCVFAPLCEDFEEQPHRSKFRGRILGLAERQFQLHLLRFRSIGQNREIGSFGLGSCFGHAMAERGREGMAEIETMSGLSYRTWKLYLSVKWPSDEKELFLKLGCGEIFAHLLLFPEPSLDHGTKLTY